MVPPLVADSWDLCFYLVNFTMVISIYVDNVNYTFRYEGGLICLLHSWLKDTASKLLSFQVFSCKSRLKTINKERMRTIHIIIFTSSFLCFSSELKN